MESIEEGKSISADLAKRVLQGDSDAIRKLRTN